MPFTVVARVMRCLPAFPVRPYRSYAPAVDAAVQICTIAMILHVCLSTPGRFSFAENRRASPSERVTNRDDCSVVVFILTLSPYSNRFPQSLINSLPRDDIIIELSFSECIKTSYYTCLVFHTISWVTATFGLLTAFKRLSGLPHVFCRPHFSPLFSV